MTCHIVGACQRFLSKISLTIFMWVCCLFCPTNLRLVSAFPYFIIPHAQGCFNYDCFMRSAFPFNSHHYPVLGG